MANPDPESFSLLAKVLAAGAAVVAPVGWFWTQMGKKADKHTVNNQYQALHNELEQHRRDDRESFRELFKNAEADRALFRDKLDDLGRKQADNHTELLRELSRKADRK